MATPRGAVPRDLEERLRRIERLLASVTGAALRRKRLEVTEGDFVVSGGGGVEVRDGGDFTTYHPSGRPNVVLGDLAPASEALAGVNGVYVALSDSATPAVLVMRGDGDFVVFDNIGFFSVDTGGGVGFALTAGSAGISGDTATGQLSLDASAAGGVQLSGGLHADDVTISPAGTTGSAANVHINASGRLLEVTSSRRYKQDIEDAPNRASEVLAVTGRTWSDRADPETRHVGYIAEELHDAGLSEYVDYDEHGQPNAIAYDRLTVPLLQLAQRQQAQIDALAHRLDALENPAPFPHA